MPICKFFQEGNCRYGQNCRFEHVYGSKYSYHANAPAPQPQKQSTGGVTDEQLVQQVHNDVQSALKGGQWLLSCYAPFKKPNFPDLIDLSPEEARLFIYEAKANNTVDQAVAYMNNLSSEARSKHEQLLTSSPNLVRTLRSLYNGESVASPFSSTPAPQSVFGQAQPQTNASSLFRSAVQTSPVQNTSPFGQTVFNQSPNVFGQQDAAKSLFSQASQNVFGAQPIQNQNVFGAPPTQSSPFGMQPQQNLSPFGQAMPQNVFGQSQNTAQSMFAQANASPDPAKSIFAQAATAAAGAAQSSFKSPFDQPSPFAQNSSTNVYQTAASNLFGQQTQADDPGVYSNINDISPEDLDMFKADSFKLGFIPEIPPPHSLCV